MLSRSCLCQSNKVTFFHQKMANYKMNRHTVVQKKLEKFMDKTAWIRFGFDHKCRAAASFPPRLWCEIFGFCLLLHSDGFATYNPVLAANLQ